MENIKEKRLVRLLDATLLYHCEEITLLDDTSLYDAMFKYLEEGELDRVFLCLRRQFPRGFQILDDLPQIEVNARLAAEPEVEPDPEDKIGAVGLDLHALRR